LPIRSYGVTGPVMVALYRKERCIPQLDPFIVKPCLPLTSSVFVSNQVAQDDVEVGIQAVGYGNYLAVVLVEVLRIAVEGEPEAGTGVDRSVERRVFSYRVISGHPVMVHGLGSKPVHEHFMMRLAF